MALFAVGTSVAMTAAPWLWLRLRGDAAQAIRFVPSLGAKHSAMQGATRTSTLGATLSSTPGATPGATQGAWGVRLAGAALAASALWAIWMGLVHNTAPWCVTPKLRPKHLPARVAFAACLCQ